MLFPAFTTQFHKDMKLMEKQKKDLTQIKAIMFDIICENELPPKNKDHKLTNNYKNHRECHIEPDWLLIYLPKDKEVTFVRTGSHSELFR